MNNVPRWVFRSLVALFALFVWVCIGKRLHQGITPTATHQTSTAVVTNTARTSETNLVPSGTNGLAIISDVGGTVSFQQSSSKTSAPVAPENPHLK